MPRERLQVIGLAGLLGGAGCDETELRVPDAVYLWLTPDKDAHVQCSAGADCRDGDESFGRLPELEIAAGPSQKRAYVHFHLPSLPEGTSVAEAYLELFHPRAEEDGTHDNRCLQGAPAVGDWDPATLTWNDQPNQIQMSRQFQVALRSEAWSGSSDIAALVDPLIADRDAHHGFVLWPTGNEPYDKSLASNNHDGRTQDDLGHAPRLLVLVEIPEDATADEVDTPDLAEDNDLPFDGEDVKVLEAAVGDDWPEDWQLAARTEGFGCQP